MNYIRHYRSLGKEPSSGTSSSHRQKEQTKTRTHQELKQNEESPYAVLNIPPTSTKDEIIAAYRRLAQMYHPDKVSRLGPEFRELAERHMKAINAAYEQLKRGFNE